VSQASTIQRAKPHRAGKTTSSAALTSPVSCRNTRQCWVLRRAEIADRAIAIAAISRSAAWTASRRKIARICPAISRIARPRAPNVIVQSATSHVCVRLGATYEAPSTSSAGSATGQTLSSLRSLRNVPTVTNAGVTLAQIGDRYEYKSRRKRRQPIPRNDLRQATICKRPLELKRMAKFTSPRQPTRSWIEGPALRSCVISVISSSAARRRSPALSLHW